MTDQAIGHCIVELLGHRRLGGYVTEQEVAGAKFLRVDIPATDGHEPMTQLVNPASVYCLTPTTEEIATKAATLARPAPVSRWELASIEAPKPQGEPDWLPDIDDATNGGPF